jgi:hypothetical protein
VTARHRRIVDRLDVDAVAVDQRVVDLLAQHRLAHHDRNDVAGIIEMRDAGLSEPRVKPRTLPGATVRRRLHLHPKDGAPFMLVAVIVVSVLVTLGTIEIAGRELNNNVRHRCVSLTVGIDGR